MGNQISHSKVYFLYTQLKTNLTVKPKNEHNKEVSNIVTAVD